VLVCGARAPKRSVPHQQRRRPCVDWMIRLTWILLTYSRMRAAVFGATVLMVSGRPCSSNGFHHVFAADVFASVSQSPNSSGCGYAPAGVEGVVERAELPR